MLSTSLLKADTSPLKSGIQSLKDNLSTTDIFTAASQSPRTPVSPSTAQGGLGGNNLMTTVDYSLNAPTISQKCSELTYLLNNCQQKDLAKVFHKIVDKMFDLSSGGRGFGITSILKSSQPREFAAISDFLSAEGPLLKASSRLLCDQYLRFEFPISLLPVSTQQLLETGMASNYITSKLSSQNTATLMLNSFEFYMFTFAAYIVQPYTPDNKFVPGESLYPSILEDYLSYFLPCDGSSPPSLPLSVSMSSPSVVKSSPPAPSPNRKSLLRQGSLLSTPARDVPSHHPTTTSASGHEVWRSETILNIFPELWLSPFSIPARPKNESPSLNQKSSDILIAVGDTLKIVRMMIKHLHFFANSGGPLDLGPLDQLKRCVIPNIKKKVYLLFKFIFTHWPHDTSFRLVLETWLSYIQPWRYTDAAARNRAADDASAVTVDEKWQGFVAENILFYTNILRLLLPRFVRMDLTASKNAYMLFRIAKIYSQTGLALLIKRGESGLDRIMSAVDFSLTSLSDNVPCLLNSVEVSDAVVAAARQCLLELEGSGTRYEPIFGNLFRQTVSEILVLATRARTVAEDSIAEFKDAKSSGSTIGWLSEILYSGSTPPQNTAEMEEFRKSVQYLNQSISSLASIFSLQQPSPSTERTRVKSGSAPGTPETTQTEGGRILTPHGRWQVLQGLAKPNIRYEGDPDLIPISQSEVGWIVRLMHKLSTKVNLKFGEKLREIYREESVIGEVSRLLMKPPCSFCYLEKSLDGAPPQRRYEKHDARVSFRLFGSLRFLVYTFGLIFFLSLILRTSLFRSTFIVIFIAAALVVTMAVIRHLIPQARPSTPYLNSTMDHSKLE